MNLFVFSLGLYILAGTLFIGLRWKYISAVGRPIMGDRVGLAIPFLIPFWPTFAWSWISDELRVFSCLRAARRQPRVCTCGQKLEIRAQHIRWLRDGQESKIICLCGLETPLAGAPEAGKKQP